MKDVLIIIDVRDLSGREIASIDEWLFKLNDGLELPIVTHRFNAQTGILLLKFSDPEYATIFRLTFEINLWIMTYIDFKGEDLEAEALDWIKSKAKFFEWEYAERYTRIGQNIHIGRIAGVYLSNEDAIVFRLKFKV